MRYLITKACAVSLNNYVGKYIVSKCTFVSLYS